MSSDDLPRHASLPQSPESWEVTLPTGLTVRGLCHGEHGAPVVIAVHGWLDNAASFTALAERLSADHRVIAIDLPGHGRSDHPSREGIYHFLNWCVWLDELIEALELSEPFTLLGHSMGAAIVLCYAGGTTREVKRIIALDGLAPGMTEASKSSEQFGRGMKSRLRASQRAPSRVADVHEAVAKMKSVRMPMSDVALSEIATRHLIQDDHGAYFGYDPMLQTTSVMRLAPTQVRGFLSSIKAPVHLIRATEGWPIDEAYFHEVISWIGSKTHLDLIKGGHHVHMDRPDDVYEAIVQGSLMSDT